MRIFLSFIVAVTASIAATQPGFRGLGVDADFSGSLFAGFSADGCVAAGNEFRDEGGGTTIQAFFSDGTGIHATGWLSGTSGQTRAVGLDADGSHLYVTALRDGRFTAGRATAGGGLEDFGDVPGSDGLYGRAVAGESGAFFVQASYDHGNAPSVAYRWTSAGGYEPIAGPAGLDVMAVSADATGMVGSLDGQAMRWDGANWVALSAPSGFVSLGGVTSGGSYIAGAIHDNGSKSGLLWENGVPKTLGDLAGGGDEGQALGLSHDGAWVVGTGTETHMVYDPVRGVEVDLGKDAAWIWSEDGGMRTVASLLNDAGLDYSGWTLTSASAVISRGGLLTIGGDGIDPLGRTQGWIATVDPSAVPEPASFLALAFGGWTLRRRRKPASSV